MPSRKPIVNQDSFAGDFLNGLFMRRVHREPPKKEPDPKTKPNVIFVSTIEELDSEDMLYTDGILSFGGPMRVCTSRSEGTNYWSEIGNDIDMSSADMYNWVKECGVEPLWVVVRLPDDIFEQYKG